MDCLLRVLYGLSIGGPKQTVYEGYLTVWTVCERSLMDCLLKFLCGLSIRGPK